MNLNLKTLKIKPIRLVVLSFLMIIGVGSLLLCLPWSNQIPGARYVDHLFTAVSSVCVTGLVVLYPVQQYTVFGQIIIMVLIQCGGLGIMTIIAYVLNQLKVRFDIHATKTVSEATGHSSLATLHGYVKRIIRYTLIFEGIGMVLLSIRFIPEFGLFGGLFNAMFLAVSAFCNAGFDNLGLTNLIPYQYDVLVSLTVSCLIIIGGLGFPVWMELSRLIKEAVEKKSNKRKVFNSMNSHARIVIKMTLMLLIGGTVVIFFFEQQKLSIESPQDFFRILLTSFFQSVTTRTAGFSTMNIATMHFGSLLVMIVLMLIGGSPSGTAGGFKTTTLYLVYRFVIQEYLEDESIIVHKKEIQRRTIKKALVVFITFLSLYFVASFILVVSLPGVDPLRIYFEAASAIGTVGLTMDLTILLNDLAKGVIMLLMFFGRLGPLAIIFAIRGNSSHKKGTEVHYAHANVLIG